MRANGVVLRVESFGNLADPAILLIHGAAASMHAWDREFCQRLEAVGRFVIRYDHRDTGRSVSYPPGEPGYSFADLTVDAIGILATHGLRRARLVGTSMGGGIAMEVALDYPALAASLTLIGTSPGGDDLPPMSPEFLAFVSGSDTPDWSDREAVNDRIMHLPRSIPNGSGHLDEAAIREAVALDVARTTNAASSQINHFVMETGDRIRDRLGEIVVPTHVIHGDMDPIVSLGHDLALAAEIPSAELLVLKRTGRELTRAAMDTVVPAITRIFGGSAAH